MDILKELNFEKLGADLVLDNIELILKEEFKEVPVVVEIFNLGRIIGRFDVVRKMQLISNACAEDATEFNRSLNDLAENLKRNMDGDYDG